MDLDEMDWVDNFYVCPDITYNLTTNVTYGRNFVLKKAKDTVSTTNNAI